MQEVGGKVLEVGFGEFDLAQEGVVREDGGNGRGNADGSGDKGFADGAGDDIEAGGANFADVLEGVHDAPDGAEQADEGGGAADAGKQGQALFHLVALLLDTLAQATLEDVLAIAAGLQAGGVVAMGILQDVEAGLGDAGQRAWAIAQLCRSSKAGGAPEGIGIGPVGAMQSPLFPAFEEDDGPGDDGKADQ